MRLGHVCSALPVGLAVAPLLGQHAFLDVARFVFDTAGAALLPDLDHHGSHATKSLGPVTRGLSWLLRRTSAAVYRATKGPRDEDWSGEHRHLTHTVVFAVAVGAAAGVVAAQAGPWAGVAIQAALLGLAFGVLWPPVRRRARRLVRGALSRRQRRSAGIALLICAAAAALYAADAAVAGGWRLSEHLAGIATFIGGDGGAVGVAIAVGCVVHCVGDSLTLMGCPFLWPMPWRGETWFEIRPPELARLRVPWWRRDTELQVTVRRRGKVRAVAARRWVRHDRQVRVALRFRTGGRFERWVAIPAFLLLAVLLVPGGPLAVDATWIPLGRST